MTEQASAPERPLTVLIVDDSPVMRKVVIRALEVARIPLGEVREARNGEEALFSIATSAPDLVLCDVHMPTMSGTELLERLSCGGWTDSVPVVMISSERGGASRSRLEAFGARAYVEKPFYPEALGRVLRGVLGALGGAMIAVTPDMLGQLAATVLADCAFLILDPAPAIRWPQQMLIAEIPFAGVTSGRLVLAASESLMVQATAEMLCLDAGDPLAAEVAPATLAELSNVLLGMLAGRYFDAEPACEMGLPETRRGSWPRTDAGVRCSSVLVDIDERPIAVALTTPAVRLT